MVTSTSSTTSTSTAATTSTTAQSIVTALGGGSGVDMAALANNLAVAQFAMRSQNLTAKSEKLESQISTASTLKNMLQGLSSSIASRVREGDLSPKPTVANSSVATASYSGIGTSSSSYSLEVTTLAKSQALTTPSYATSSSTVGSGTLTLRFGTVSGTSFTEDTTHAAVNITIPDGAKLSDVVTAINGANAGVTAYIANTASGAQIVLKGQEGAANGFILEASENVSEPGLSQLAWQPSTGSAARLLASAGDAEFKLDGLSMTSSSNTVNNVAPGLSLKLTGTNSGSPTAVSFADPSTAISGVMQDLTEALNEIMSELNTATDPMTGELARDSGARALKRTFAALTTTLVMPNAASGAPRTLADLGLKIERDGTFTFDSTRLNSTLKANPTATAAMFTNGLYGVFATFDGIARKATSASDPGSLGGSISRYTSQKTKLTENITELADKQEKLRASLVSRFAVSESYVSTSKSTLSFLQNQIDAWNAQNKN